MHKTTEELQVSIPIQDNESQRPNIKEEEKQPRLFLRKILWKSQSPVITQSLIKVDRFL